MYNTCTCTCTLIHVYVHVYNTCTYMYMCIIHVHIQYVTGDVERKKDKKNERHLSNWKNEK